MGRKTLDQILSEMGIDLKSGVTRCPASNEVHDICDWLLDNVEMSHEDYKRAMEEQDEVGAFEIRIAASVMYEIAQAIHDGEHLEHAADKAVEEDDD